MLNNNPMIVLSLFLCLNALTVVALSACGHKEAKEVEGFVLFLPWPFIMLAAFV